MTGRFNRIVKAAAVHSKVVVPKTGNIPRTIPPAMHSDIFLKLIPSLSIDFTKFNIFVLTAVIMKASF